MLRSSNASLKQQLQGASFYHADVQLRVGSRVRIHGLRSAVELNDSHGTCEHWEAVEGRWKVRLSNGDLKAVLPENLQVARIDSASACQPEDVARQVAEIECGPLRACAAEHRPILK